MRYAKKGTALGRVLACQNILVTLTLDAGQNVFPIRIVIVTRPASTIGVGTHVQEHVALTRNVEPSITHLHVLASRDTPAIR